METCVVYCVDIILALILAPKKKNQIDVNILSSQDEKTKLKYARFFCLTFWRKTLT